MRIAFDNQIVRTQQYGGISNYIFNLAKYLNNDADIQAKVFAGTYINRYFLSDKTLIQGTYLSDFPPFTKKILRYASDVSSSLSLKQWQPDILHLTFHKNTLFFTQKIPKVITVYDFIPEIFALKMPGMKEKKEAIQKADSIICISNHTRNDLLNFFPEVEGKSEVVYLGHKMPGSANEESISDTFPGPLPPYILYVGLRGDYKNFEGFIKGFASSDFLKKEFNIVCFGDAPFSNEEKKLFAELHLNPSKIHHFSGDSDKLAAFYKSASLFVYPSLYEGFGIPPLEAFALGCPVAASNVSSIPEVCGDACVYFDPANPDDIAVAIEKAVTDSVLRKSLISKGYLRASFFTWEKCAAETSKVYKTLL